VPFPNLPPRSAWQDFAWHDRPVHARRWGNVGLDHSVLSVGVVLPLHPCLEVVIPVEGLMGRFATCSSNEQLIGFGCDDGVDDMSLLPSCFARPA
jgi:hypothetical protein